MTLEEFTTLASSANVVPMTRTLLADMHTPVSAYLALRHGTRQSFLFESVEPNEKVGRHSFIGIDPLLTVRSSGQSCEIQRGNDRSTVQGSIFDALKALSSEYRTAGTEQLSGLSGGFVGYLGYDVVRQLEPLEQRQLPHGREEESMFGLFASVIRFDHQRQIITLVHNVLINDTHPLEEQYDAGRQQLDTLELRLRRPALNGQHFSLDGQPEESMSREAYCEAVRRAKQHIVEGDIFQVVLARRIQMRYKGDLFPVYRALRTINPSPYLFYLDFGTTTLVGSSPEVLLRVEHGEASVLPIAGTRKRGSTMAEDLAMEEELCKDEKELAEHIMLVDLGRNDIGRIAEYGSVEIPVLKKVERYSHVMHLVSEVKGKLRGDKSSLDALMACFPAGTVSGAPKVRAMQIIDDLEPLPRGAYAGAVGYLGFNGALDTCIAIRTIIAHEGTLSIQAGAGIVADSVPEKEYEETVNKARALMEAVRMAAEGLRLRG